MNAFTISLRALKHPLSLASISLLLLNDHVLKTAAPSILTGKMSDFAGLFFFPFLLAAAISLLSDRVSLPTRWMSAIAFGTTLVWFTLIKTLPFANALTAAALTQVLGQPVRIQRDPSDLLALVALWPAWRVWLRLESAPPSQPPGKAAYLALGLASLAALATSPCPPQARLVRLVVFQQTIYANPGLDNGSGASGSITASSDGIRWEMVDRKAVPEGILPQLQQTVQWPVIVCEASNPPACYRTSGAEQVEGSTDGGQTWKVIWQIPWGRRQFMERYLGSFLLSCKTKLDLGPYDLALLSRDGRTTLVAAMGNEGILVRTPDGAWERVEVLNATPTPYAGGSLFSLLLVETGVSLAAALLAWIVLSVWGGKAILSRARQPEGRSTAWAIAPAWWGIGLLVASWAVLAVLFSSGNLRQEPFFILLAVSVIAIFGGPALTWSRVVSLSTHPVLARRAGWACTLAAAGIFPLAWLPFVAWVSGLIPVYALALAIALLIGVASLFGGVTATRQALGAMPAMDGLGAATITPGEETPRLLPGLRWQLGIFGVLLVIVALFAPLPTFFPGLFNRLFSSPFLLKAFIAFLGFGLLGLAGLWFSRKLDLPGILGLNATHPGGLIGLLLTGAALGGGFALASRLLPTGITRSGVAYGWLFAASGAIGEEIAFRLFLISVLAFLLTPRLRRWRGPQAGFWVANLVATLAFGLASPMASYLLRGGISAGVRWFVLVELAFRLAVGWTAGKRFQRDGLAGAACIHLAASFGWQWLWSLYF